MRLPRPSAFSGGFGPTKRDERGCSVPPGFRGKLLEAGGRGDDPRRWAGFGGWEWMPEGLSSPERSGPSHFPVVGRPHFSEMTHRAATAQNWAGNSKSVASAQHTHGVWDPTVALGPSLPTVLGRAVALLPHACGFAYCTSHCHWAGVVGAGTKKSPKCPGEDRSVPEACNGT